jgi:chromosome segregation ATPase
MTLDTAGHAAIITSILIGVATMIWAMARLSRATSASEVESLGATLTLLQTRVDKLNSRSGEQDDIIHEAQKEISDLRAGLDEAHSTIVELQQENSELKEAVAELHTENETLRADLIKAQGRIVVLETENGILRSNGNGKPKRM